MRAYTPLAGYPTVHLDGDGAGARDINIVLEPGEYAIFAVLASGRIAITTPGETAGYSPTSPAWVRIVVPSQAETQAATSNLTRASARIDVQFVVGNVWTARRPAVTPAPPTPAALGMSMPGASHCSFESSHCQKPSRSGAGRGVG